MSRRSFAVIPLVIGCIAPGSFPGPVIAETAAGFALGKHEREDGRSEQPMSARLWGHVFPRDSAAKMRKIATQMNAVARELRKQAKELDALPDRWSGPDNPFG